MSKKHLLPNLTDHRYASSNWIFTGYLFGRPGGRPFTWFAWYPVRTQDGKWVWWKHVGCIRIIKKPWLDGPDWSFWSYSDIKVIT